MEKIKEIKVKIQFIEPLMGTAPLNEKIYSEFIGSKAPDAVTLAEEVEALGVDAVEAKGMTGFPRNADGDPIIWDYQVKGFFKDACGMLNRLKGKTESSKIKAFKKQIDGLVFVEPRMIKLEDWSGEIGVCQRALRAQTMQGERVALASSEELPVGTTAEFRILLLDESLKPAVLEWLGYGKLRGLGQWRNSGKGRFTFTAVEEDEDEAV